MEVEEGEGGGSEYRGGGGGGTLRTRSQVAPDWTVKESLIFVNEISAVEAECLNTLSSFQKWKIVVENCNALDVNRGLDQCRRHWDSLLADYKKIKQWHSSNNSNQKKNGCGYWSLDVDRRRQFRLPENFDADLFKAIDDHDKTREGRWDTDPDTDPDAEADADADADLLINLIAESGSKKRKRRGITPKKRSRKEREKPQRSIKSEKTIKAERCSSEEKVDFRRPRLTQRVVVDEMAEETNNNNNISPEEKEQILSTKLRENAELINATIRGQDVDYKLADLKNLETIQTDIARRQADDLVVYLRNITDTLDQLCKLVQEGA